MTSGPRKSLSLSPGIGLLLLAPVLGAAVVVPVFLYRASIAPFVPQPWDDLLHGPALIGQGAFVAVLYLIFVEWWLVVSERRRVDAMTRDDSVSWAGRTRLVALTMRHPRPNRLQRETNLRQCRVRLGWKLNLRWAFYSLLAVAPTVGGFLLGKRLERLNESMGVPYAELYTALWVGSVETVILWMLGVMVRWQARSMLDAWLTRALQLEAPVLIAAEPAKPAAPVPPPEQPRHAGPATPVRVAVAATAAPPAPESTIRFDE